LCDASEIVTSGLFTFFTMKDGSASEAAPNLSKNLNFLFGSTPASFQNAMFYVPFILYSY
jgi:hypothetical protein